MIVWITKWSQYGMQNISSDLRSVWLITLEKLTWGHSENNFWAKKLQGTVGDILGHDMKWPKINIMGVTRAADSKSTFFRVTKTSHWYSRTKKQGKGYGNRIGYLIVVSFFNSCMSLLCFVWFYNVLPYNWHNKLRCTSNTYAETKYLELWGQTFICKIGQWLKWLLDMFSVACQ